MSVEQIVVIIVLGLAALVGLFISYLYIYDWLSSIKDKIEEIKEYPSKIASLGAENVSLRSETNQLSVELSMYKLALEGEINEIARLLEVNGRNSSVGKKAESMLSKLEVPYTYIEEVITVTGTVCVKNGTQCAFQGNNGCNASSGGGCSFCHDAVWEDLTETEPRKVIINHKNSSHLRSHKISQK